MEATGDFQVTVRTAAGDTMTLQLAGIDATVPMQGVHAARRDAALKGTAWAAEQYLSEFLVGKTVKVHFAASAQLNGLEPPLPTCTAADPSPAGAPA